MPCVTHTRAVVAGECLAGALFWGDLYSIAEEVGFSPPRLVTASPITIGDKELEGVVGEGPDGEQWLRFVTGRGAGTLCSAPGPLGSLFLGDCRFVSATFRLFKVPGSSRAGPGQVIYNGGIVGHERELVFDANFTFKVWGAAFWASGDGEHTQPEGLGMGQH